MPEYINLHLDRNSYFAGDRIWYAIYINNTPRSPSSLSNVVYVDLLDARDSVVARQKIKCRDGRGHGDMLLSNKLRTGNYRVLAYTLWMKNKQGVESWQATIPVINLDIPFVVQSGVEKPDPQDDNVLKIATSSDGQFHVVAPASGKVVAFDREEVLMLTEVARGQEVTFSCTDRDHDAITFALLDKSGDVVESREIDCHHSVLFAVEPDRREVKPRQKFELSVLLTDKYRGPLTGNISVSVRSVEPSWERLPQKSITWLGLRADSYGSGSRKEMFVHPADPASLKPIQQPYDAPVPYEINIDSSRARYIEEVGTNRNIVRAFGLHSYFEREAGYNIPYNISYETKDFQALPTLEDFIREVVPQVKIRRASGEKRLFLRYVGENSLVYVFKESALILMDGFVYTGNDDYLQMSLSDIDRIELTWGMREINSMGVFSLADNGVIAIHSKSRSLRHTGVDLWKEFYHPLVFNTGYESPGDEVPKLAEPVYWNPALQLNGKAKISVQAPDRPGELIIEVRGLSDTGHEISANTRITVKGE